MSVIVEATWDRLLPLLRERCPRLTPADIEAVERRSDLLAAKIQNRHWVDRQTAERLVLELLQSAQSA